MFGLKDLKNKYPRLYNLYVNTNEDYLGLIAAGIAFYFLMAAFPALAAAVSLYGIFSDPNFISDQINLLSRFLPKEALAIFANQATSLVSSSNSALSISFLISVVFALYSATKGVGSLIKGLNIAYNEKEKRKFFRLALTGFMLTFVLLAYLLGALTLIAGLPAFFNIIHLPDFTSDIYLVLRWPLLFMTALFGLEILYFYGPSHTKPRWQWISPGSFIATILWLIVSSGFSLFVTHFGKYNETYGSISAIIVLLLWFWLSAMTILMGAEINQSFRPSERHRKNLNLAAGSETENSSHNHHAKR